MTRGADVRPADIRRWGPRWATKVGWALNHLWWRTSILGAEHVPARGPVIIAANHTGIVDGPVVYGAVPRASHFIVKQEFFDSRLGFLMTYSGQIPVDRSNGRAALSVGKALLEEGRAVGIFPEGTRGRGDVSSVKAGVAWLAVNTGAPIVPVAALGTRRTGDPRGYVPPARARLHVVFGEPFRIDTPPEVPRREVMAEAITTIGSALSAHVARAVELTGVALPADDGRR